MKKRTPVSKIMSKNIITVNKTQSLQAVSEIMDSKHIRHVPVVSGEVVIGMISQTDLQKVNFVSNYEGDSVGTTMYDVLSIEQVMTKNISSVQQEETIHDVAVILSEKDFHALPVLDGKTIVGIVTSTDLIKYLIEQY